MKGLMTYSIAVFLVIFAIISCSKTSGPALANVQSENPVTSSDLTIITLNGNVINENGSAVTNRGFCVSKKSNPTLADVVYPASAKGPGPFQKSLGYLYGTLAFGTKYYYKAFATNSIGTSFSQEFSFTTLSNGSLTLSPATNITNNSAKVILNVEYGGFQAKSITIKTPPSSPDLTTPNLVDKSFTLIFSSLLPNKTYSVNAKLITSLGLEQTVNSNGIIIVTQGPPIYKLTGISSYTGNGPSPLFIFEIQSDGGDAITDYGLCYSLTNKKPTITDTKIASKDLLSNKYSVQLSALKKSTTYYVTGYAKNKYYVTYSDVVAWYY
jgi:hypothetical protein